MGNNKENQDMHMLVLNSATKTEPAVRNRARAYIRGDYNPLDHALYRAAFWTCARLARQWPALLIISILATACTQPTPGPRVSDLRCPASHADPMAACEEMLARAFPDTCATTWEILDCGDMGVLATDGLDTWHVNPAGDTYEVEAGCEWTLVASESGR